MFDIYDSEEQEQLKREIEIEKSYMIQKKCANQEIAAPAVKKLKRELQAEALSRLEDAARTTEDFNNVIQLWDKLDANRERKERYHEVSRGDNIPLDYGAADSGMYFPRSLNKSVWKQISKGEFIEAIYNCPYEIDELVTESYLSQILKNLRQDQKELLYLSVIKEMSAKHIAEIYGQTDRNIRKKLDVIYRKIRKQIYDYLTSPQAENHSFTIEEKKFLKDYQSNIDNKKNK